MKRDNGPVNENLNRDQFSQPEPSKNLTVITQHGEDRTVRRKRFAYVEDAEAYAKSMTPDHDGSVVPNVDDKFGEHKDYSQGFFWHGNRYAVVHAKGPVRYRE